MSIILCTLLHFYRFRCGLIRLQAHVRGVLARSNYHWLLYRHHSAKTIQRAYRGYFTRTNLFKTRVLDVHDAAEANDYDRLLLYATHLPDLLFELDVYGNTALHNAVKAASKRTVKLLLRMNFDPNALNTAGYTPLHLLIGSEASGRDALLHYLLEHGFNEDIPTPDGKSCLLLACYYGHVGLVEAFLNEHHIDPHLADHHGTTCLQIAATNGSYEIVDLLLLHGADCHQAGFSGATALHSVSYSGNLDIAKLLISFGAYVNAFDEFGLTPLMYACQQGFVNLMQYFLVDCGANLLALDSSGKTAVHHAAMSNHAPALHALREADANFDDVDNQGNTAMHLAAEQGYYEVVKTLLQEGAHCSYQNSEGNQPLHLAARNNHVSVMRVLVVYDKHVGRVNYQHQTPLGIAKFYGCVEAQEFLEDQFYRLEDEDVRDEEGNLWWDKGIVGMTDDWRVEVSPMGVREYINDASGERRQFPPVMSAMIVDSAAEFVEMKMQRVVQTNEGVKEHTMNAYTAELKQMDEEVANLKRQNDAQIIIAKYVRRKLAYKVYAVRKLRDDREKVITRFLVRTAPKFRRWRLRFLGGHATKIQALYRGYKVRVYMRWEGGFYELWYIKYGTNLARTLTNAWMNYRFGMLARLTLFFMRAPKTREAWRKVLEAAGKPRRIIGVHEEYLYPNTYDILFYRNVTTGQIFLGVPAQIEEKDRLEREEAKEISKYGYSLAQNRLAIKLQALWRGYKARSYDLLVRRAIKISKDAEELYFSNPNLDRNIINYALYTHVVLRDYTKARVVYGEAVRRMVFRGPDVSFILYAYAVFAFVSHEQDILDCMLMIDRAKKAEETRALSIHTDRIDEIEKSIADKTFPYGNIFHLADRGFYRHSAHTGFCREGWHNYAACRFLVYDDYAGALEAFLTAFRYDPGNKILNSNFYAMMTHYHGNDKMKINEIINSKMRELTRAAYSAESKQKSKMEKLFILSITTLRIQRWYRNWKAKRTKVRRVSTEWQDKSGPGPGADIKQNTNRTYNN